MEQLYNTLTHSRPECGDGQARFNPPMTRKNGNLPEYNRLDASLHRLPDFYFENLSSTCSPDYQQPADDKIRDECKQVRNKITQVFSTY